MSELINSLSLISKNNSIRVIIISASGNIFCSGHDLNELILEKNEDSVEKIFKMCSQLMLAIQNQPQPVIAQVQGIATAAGCQLVASCDLAVSSSNALFATPGVDIGLFCTTPLVALSRSLSKKHALEMLFTGEKISANKAKEIGLINKVVEKKFLKKETFNLAKIISEKPTNVIKLGKKSFYNQINLPIEEAYKLASKIMANNMMKTEAKIGIDSFFKKEKPNWPED
tara:strand:- start:491 stop:1174 length:684 start_codon:yes stop_codon:yes gene_type:complete